MKFSKDTKIMLDRDYCNIGDVEFKIMSIDKKECCIKLTKKGLQTLKKQVRHFIYDFVVNDLDRLFYFGIEEDLEPHAFKQVLEVQKMNKYICPKCKGDKEKDNKFCGWCQIGGNPELKGTEWEVQK